MSINFYTFSTQRFRLFLLLAFFAISAHVQAQQLDLSDPKGMFGKGNPLKISGGLAANTVFYNGNGGYGRDPFSYMLNGNMSVNVLGKINLPFSFNMTNVGRSFNYPVLPNRLSLHPSYKWATAHIGDVGMSFSPYTLNGHLFTGAGIDLTPNGPLKLSAMYGRLQRAVEYDSLNMNALPAYERMGYGAKLTYEQEKYTLGLHVFGAKDNPNSLFYKPDSLLIYPQSNLATGIEIGYRPSKELAVKLEYATSVLTRDIRAQEVETTNDLSLSSLVRERASTSVYSALKTQVAYSLRKGSIGVEYERVDPGYETLGAYYFNNDMENMTATLAHTLFQDKVNFNMNLGMQQDDLDGDKTSRTRRMIGSANVNYMPSEKVNVTLAYSNFQTYMNLKPQFRLINQVSDYEYIDTLDFTQISQNASVNALYLLGNDDQKSQSLNVNLSFQDAADKQGDVVRMGSGSQFYNLASAYTISFLPYALSVTGAFNLSYNTIGRNDFVTLGPTLAINKRLLDKKLSTGFSTSYNRSMTDAAVQNTILNIRCNIAYQLLNRHSFALSTVNQFRDRPGHGRSRDFTATIGYNFSLY